MAATPPLPTLDFYERPDCAICAEARTVLQAVLEDRARRGQPIAGVRYVDVAGQPDLEARYGAVLPVLALAGRELSLTTSYRAIDHFLNATLPALA